MNKVYKVLKIILAVSIVILVFTAIFLVFDHHNDKTYLVNSGFDNQGFYKEVEGYDNYCKDSTDSGEGCRIYYDSSFLHPTFYMYITFGDGTNMTYETRKVGLLKKEVIDVAITDGNEMGFCIINGDFSVVESEDNSQYCSTDKYKRFISMHKDYIDDALKQYNSYYGNFNMSRNFNN